MAVQPSQNVNEILSTSLGGGRQAGNTQIDRSGGQQANGRQAGRVVSEPAGGYDPKAPRGTYVDISA